MLIFLNGDNNPIHDDNYVIDLYDKIEWFVYKNLLYTKQEYIPTNIMNNTNIQRMWKVLQKKSKPANEPTVRIPKNLWKLPKCYRMAVVMKLPAKKEPINQGLRKKKGSKRNLSIESREPICYESNMMSIMSFAKTYNAFYQ